VLGGALKFAPLAPWNITLRGGRSQDNSDIFFNGLHLSRYNTQHDSVMWQNDVALNENQLLTAGLDVLNDRIDALPDVTVPTQVFTQTSRSNHAVFGQYQGSFGAHSLQASARHDNNQQFGGHNTSGLGYGYAVNDTMRLTASYGSAFKAPNFNSLYYPGFGNPALRPELSRSIEMGVTGHWVSGKWSLNAYQTNISDLIVFDTNYKPVNATARLTGLEGQLQTHLANCDINGTLTLQDPRQISGAYPGKLLNRRATEAMRIEVAHDLGRYRFASSLYTEGRRFDDLANTGTKRLGGYGLLDVRAEYRIAPDWLMQGRIDNLLGKRYETAQFYNQAGRGLYFTLNYQPKN